jgi:hypothetical protein
VGETGALTPLQIQVARISFELETSDGFLVAGGAALLASELMTRLTADLDLFASGPIASVTDAKLSLVEALQQHDHDVSLIQDRQTFCRMVVRRADDEVLVDLAIDSPPHTTPTITALGPTLAPLELAGRKLLALFGRAEARDFADVYLLAQRFGKEALLERVEALDAGIDRTVLAQMLGTLERFADDEIPLGEDDFRAAHAFFRTWIDELS